MATASVLMEREVVSQPSFKVPAFFKPSKLIDEQFTNRAFTPVSLAIGNDLDEFIRDLSMNMKYGVFQIESTPQAPFESISQLFKKIGENPDLAARANNAYNKNLVYKDAYGAGQGGLKVDEKKVIDLSPSRLDTILDVDAGLAEQFGSPLDRCLSFFDSVRADMAPKILKALAVITGDDGIMQDNMVNYRMVDYPSRPSKANRNESDHGPRCGVHRDFGTFTLIFPDGVAGLEVQLSDENEWRPLNVSPGSAVLLFGWCAAIRANDRVPAILHRVADAKENLDGTVPRRMSAVFFLAPSPDTILQPKLLHKDETAIYRRFTALELKNNVGRKWRYREGTLNDRQEIEMEEDENKTFPTQDDVIQHLFKH